ncbi:MAG: hypothetical protein RL367_1344 [Pseudomonadota bacterium]
MGYIDTDTHVIECEQSWDYLEPSERHYRPRQVEVTSPDGSKLSQFYLIGESMARRFPTDVRPAGYGAEFTGACSHLWDPAVRIGKMDALGVDVHIVMSTNFIGSEIEDPLAEAAIMRSWNRWVGERTQGYQDRLNWVMVCPTRSISRAIEEVEFCSKNGARGVMLKGIDHGYYLDDPRFYPLYEKAQDLDMTIVVHQGATRKHLEGTGTSGYYQSAAQFMHYPAITIAGFYAVISSDLYKRFPRLRWAFAESGVSWVPYAFHHFARHKSTGMPETYIQTERGPSRAVPEIDIKAEMAMRNIYVSCETDEDLPYVSSVMGDDHITVGTDFCHNDNGSDPLAHTIIMERTDLDPAVARKFVDTNGRKAFNIPTDFTPSAHVSAEAKREVSLATL